MLTPLSKSAVACHKKKDFRSGPCTLLHVARPLSSLVPTVDRTGAFTSSSPSRIHQDSRPFTHYLDFDRDFDSAISAKAEFEITDTSATPSRTTSERDGRRHAAVRAGAIVHFEQTRRGGRQRPLLLLLLLYHRRIDVLRTRSGHESRAVVISHPFQRRRASSTTLPAQLVSQHWVRYRFESTFTCARS